MADAAKPAAGGDSSLAAKIVKRATQLKNQRSTVDQKWLDCYDMTYPMRGVQFSLGGVLPAGPDISIGYGSSKKAALLDSTGTDSARILASALKEGTTSSNSRWFGLTIGQSSDEEEQWLDAAADTLWQNIHQSNYDAVGYECMLDFSVAGMFALFIDEDKDLGGFTFEEWPLAQCYFAASKPGGMIDTVYRCFSLTAEQAFSEYGEKLSERVRKQAETEPDAQVEFIHAIYPREGAKPGARMSKNLPFASCHVEVGVKGTLRESGFHEMPVVVPRWQLIPNSVLAVGPAFEALPDLRTLNKVMEFDLANSDMAIAGMWGVVDDGVLNPRTLRVGPRKLITVASKDSIFPLTPGGKPDLANDKILRLQAQVRRTFMADQLMPQPESPVETATAVMVRVELIRQLLGPVYGRMQAEFLKRMVERCFGLAFRAGVFLPPPRSLAGKQFQVAYESPQARAQRLQDVSAMDRYELSIGAQAQAGMQDALDVYDWDEARRERARLLGVPLKLLPKQQDIDAVRADRAQRQASAAQAQAALSLAEKGIGKPTPGLPAGASAAVDGSATLQ